MTYIDIVNIMRIRMSFTPDKILDAYFVSPKQNKGHYLSIHNSLTFRLHLKSPDIVNILFIDFVNRLLITLVKSKDNSSRIFTSFNIKIVS